MTTQDIFVMKYLARAFRSNTSDIGRQLLGGWHDKRVTTQARGVCKRLQKRGLTECEDRTIDGCRYVIWSLTAKGYKYLGKPVPKILAKPQW